MFRRGTGPSHPRSSCTHDTQLRCDVTVKPGATRVGAARSALPNAVLRPVRDRNAFEATVEQLASAVRLGALVDGSRLPPERELASRLGVSRATLREAIAALRSAGLVATTAGRGGGTMVTYAGEPADPTRAGALREKGPQLHDALDFRRVVEPGAAYLAATRTLDRERQDWLRACLAEVSGADTPEAHRVADSRLHLAIATLSESPLLIEAVTQVQAQVHEMLTAIPVLPRNIEHSNQQHARIVRAVISRRPASARSVMEEHCDATSALLRGLLG
jgi:GntR family transcriptional regulator, transcriptional repressor for pyruvate dehydrogenase complex